MGGKMNTVVKLLNPVSNCTRIRNCIEDYVTSIHPFDLQIGWLMGNINYLYPNKPEDNSAGYIAFDVQEKGRLKLKTARYLTRKCKLNSDLILNDEQIRILAEKINSLLWTDDELNNAEVISGSAITKAYKDEIGGSSCMTGYNSGYTRLYEINPTRFQMLIIRSVNDSARAIVHKLDNDKKLLGMVYTTAEHLYDKMQDYAIQHNWFRYDELDEIPKKDLIMSNLNFCEGEIPYMDVLTEGEIDNDLLTVSYNSGLFSLQDQNGGLGNYQCEMCDERINEDDTYNDDNGNIYCEYCFNENFKWCEHCEIPTPNEDSIFINNENKYVCRYCADKHYHKCESCNEYYNSDDIRDIDSDCYCENCFDKVADCCEDCGETFYTEDLTSVGDNGPLCADCAMAVQEAEGTIL